MEKTLKYIFRVEVLTWRVSIPKESQKNLRGHLDLSVHELLTTAIEIHMVSYGPYSQDAHLVGFSSYCNNELIGQRNCARTGWLTPMLECEPSPV